MRSSRWLLVLAPAIFSACGLYNEELLGQAVGNSGDGDGTGDGDTIGDGDGDTTGDGDGDGDGVGGTSGGSPATGGGSGGGTPSGGSGGGDTGGASGGGGTGGGTGGSPVVSLCVGICVDNMNHPSSGNSWTNPNGAGKLGLNWMKYDDKSVGGVWTSPATATNFMSPRADHPSSAGNTEKELHVVTSGFSDWGTGVFVNLVSSGPGTVNLTAPTAYKGVRFYAKRGATGYSLLNIKIEDAASHPPPVTDPPAPVVPHPALLATLLLNEAWELHEIPFEDFDKPIDLTAVYAIHFTMDTIEAPDTVDYSIDDLSFYP